jgi:hypothetical protein
MRGQNKSGLIIFLGNQIDHLDNSFERSTEKWEGLNMCDCVVNRSKNICIFLSILTLMKIYVKLVHGNAKSTHIYQVALPKFDST